MPAGVSVSNSVPSIVLMILTLFQSWRFGFGLGYQYVDFKHSHVARPIILPAVAPSLVKNGLAFGRSISDDYPLVSYVAMSFSDPELYLSRPSPRYWLLWPGVLIMLMYSMADVVLTLGPLIRSKLFIYPFACIAEAKVFFSRHEPPFCESYELVQEARGS